MHVVRQSSKVVFHSQTNVDRVGWGEAVIQTNPRDLRMAGLSLVGGEGTKVWHADGEYIRPASMSRGCLKDCLLRCGSH